MSSIQRRRSGSECGGNIFEGNCKCDGGMLPKCTLESVGEQKSRKKSFDFRHILLPINLMINLILFGFHAEIKAFF
jgi:hypothetical protein